MEEEAGKTPLLGQDVQAIHGLWLDWLGHPADTRQDLGGWKCVFCILGAIGLVYATFFTVLNNLVVYLVQVVGDSNDVAAKTVTNLAGTAFLSSFIGALLSDTYLGRLWASMGFEFLTLVGFLLSSIAAQLISKGVLERTFLLLSLYFMVVSVGSTFPNLMSLGADQLSSSNEKGKYFTMVPMAINVGQIFATTMMTYLDNLGLWVWGFWLCSLASGLALGLLMAVAWACRHSRASGNPLLRIAQVLVVALRNWNRVVRDDSSCLHETDGELSAIPGCRKLPHTSSFRFLDKAAVPQVTAAAGDRDSAWHLCTVTQVEEVKCLINVLPVGLVSTCISVAGAQVNTLFVEQASAMNTQVTSWLTILPASLQLFSIAGSVVTGLALNLGGAGVFGRCLSCGKRQTRATSFQVLGFSLVVGITAMVIAGAVEALRLLVAHKSGSSILSVVWLIPQTILLGACTMLLFNAVAEIFYSEVSDGMRALGASVVMFFVAGGNYLSSVLVSLVTYFSVIGGHSSWIASDLDEGHLDYFYWFLAGFLTCVLALYTVYAHFYAYNRHSQIDTAEPVLPKYHSQTCTS